MASTHVLPELGFGFSDLEPVIDARTMEIHHGKHHATYVTNLNNALSNHEGLQNRTIEDLITNLESVPDAIRTVVRNNGGGHYNHSLFWKWIKPGGAKSPVGQLEKDLTATFGSVDAFMEKFSAASVGRFGSGWGWLALDSNKKLVVYSTANQDNPLMEGLKPLLGLDVWEHAYYLNYQNRRADYVKAFWSIVNWDFVNELYQKAK